MSKIIQIILLIFIIFTYTIQLSGQERWSSINFKDKFKDTLLVNDYFIYSDFVFKDDNGDWQSGMADENGNMIIDTSLYLIGSNCVVDNGDPHLVKFCDCFYNTDTLSIIIYDSNPAYFDEIYIHGLNSKFTSSYKTVYQLYYPGEKYHWETKNQKLKLNTNNFEKGRWLNGFINMDVDEFFQSNTYPLTLSKIKIKGYFKCIIQ